MEQDNSYSLEQSSQPLLLDLRENIVDVALPPKIRVDARLFGAEKWEQMIADSQTDGKERGVFVSTDRKGTAHFSDVRESEDSVNDVSVVSLSEGFAPHGFRSFIPGRYRLEPFAFVHTHPLPSDLDNLPTSALSTQDLASFSASAVKVYIVLDRGGAHLLLKRNVPHQTHAINAKEIVDQAYKTAEHGTQSVAEVRRMMGEQLAKLGYFYYFSSDIAVDDNILTLEDTRRQVLPTETTDP
jgi:hypothetical protein